MVCSDFLILAAFKPCLRHVQTKSCYYVSRLVVIAATSVKGDFQVIVIFFNLVGSEGKGGGWLVDDWKEKQVSACHSAIMIFHHPPTNLFLLSYICHGQNSAIETVFVQCGACLELE